jgi:hypothetical protein
MNMDLSNKYSKAMEVCVQNSDHAVADALLCELLTILGYRSVCEIYNRVSKYPQLSTPFEEESEIAKAIETVTHNRKSKK